MTKAADGTITPLLPPGVARWTLSGRSTAEEVWAFDWWTQPGTGVSAASQWQTTVEDMDGVIQATGLYSALQPLLPSSGAVTDLKAIYYRNTQTATFVGAKNKGAGAVGTGTANSPLQQSLCVTLLTDIPGRSTRGRLYLPAPALALDANRRFVAGNLTAVMTALKQVLSAGNTVGEYGPPVVVSKVLTIATKITSIRWDLKPDIQRRRANRQSDGGRTVMAVS